MGINILFVVLTFIIIIAVILLADSLMTAMLIVSLLANFLVISAQFGKISRSMLGISAQDWDTQPAQTSDQPTQTNDDQPTQSNDDQETDPYGPFYEMWHAYHTGYTSCYDPPAPVVGVSCSERGYNIDAANTFIAQQRARDKKCTDGWVTKDANYFKHHFGGELDLAENKPWWGRPEW